MGAAQLQGIGMVDKRRIDKLVGVYIDHQLSVSIDAGWHNCGTMEKLMLPFVPPRADLVDMGMINEVSFLRNAHAEYPKIAYALAEIKVEYHNAIIAKHRLNGLSESGSAYTDHDRARAINQDLATYRYNLGKAYYALDNELEKIERYERLKTAC